MKEPNFFQSRLTIGKAMVFCIVASLVAFGLGYGVGVNRPKCGNGAMQGVHVRVCIRPLPDDAGGGTQTTFVPKS